MTDIFQDEIEARLASYEQGVGHYYRPLAEAADEFIKFSQTPDLRVFTGIEMFDQQMRGVAPGELCIITGFAHSGKTVFATEILMANHQTPMVLFTPDETRSAVLTKLAAADTGVGAEELERRIYLEDETAKSLLREVAAKYQQLAVYDESVTLHQMDIMFEEAAEVFGRKPKAVVFDYAEQLNEGTDTRQKLDMFKRWGKDRQVAFFLLHQTSRSTGASGRELGIDAGSYGGEQQATFMITVRRKLSYYKDRLRELEYKISNSSNKSYIEKWEDQIRQIIHTEIPRHGNTVSIGLVKNKRPPMRLVPEFDFEIDQTTGRLAIDRRREDDDQQKHAEFDFESSGSGRSIL